MSDQHKEVRKAEAGTHPADMPKVDPKKIPAGDRPLRVVLMAPTTVVGGITSWTRRLMKYTDGKLIQYSIIDTSKKYAPLGKKLGPIGALYGVRDAVVRLFKLCRLLWKFRPDMAYFTCAPSIGMAVRDCPLILLLRLLGIPSIVHLRGGDIKGFFGVSLPRRMIVSAALKRCLAILVITRPVEETAKAMFGNDKVIYVPNMIDDETVAEAESPVASPAPRQDDGERPIRLLHVAWQAREKGSLDLVEAVKQTQSNVQCWMVGTLAEENRCLIQGTIDRLGVDDRVFLTGVKCGPELWEHFRGADIFVFPSHSEGFPNVILEAMAYGLPILATNVGNIAEMICAGSDQPAGILIGPDGPADPAEVAKQIDLLACDPQRRQQLAANGQQSVKRYLASIVVPHLERLVRHLYCRRKGVVDNKVPVGDCVAISQCPKPTDEEQ